MSLRPPTCRPSNLAVVADRLDDIDPRRHRLLNADSVQNEINMRCHDLELADRIITMQDGRIVGDDHG